jgi:hypothetical protein
MTGTINSSFISNSHAAVDVTGSGRGGYGGLVGNSLRTLISNSYATGDVTWNGVFDPVWEGAAGGLVGVNQGSIGNSYATGKVTSNKAGGLVGIFSTYSNDADDSVTISNSYATGEVNGAPGVAGGLIGELSSAFVNATVTVTASFWDTETSGQATGYGAGTGTFTFNATGKTTAEMQSLATFAGWDIDDAGGTGKVWRIYEGHTTPLLRGFLTALTVTANNAAKTYDGVAYSGGNGVSYSTTPDGNLLGVLGYGGSSQGAINVGNYAIAPYGLYSSQLGYDIAYANGVLTIAAASTAPSILGTPADGYAGAVISASGGTASDAPMGDARAPEMTLLASADGTTGADLPGLTIIPCGQNLPQNMTCR